MRDRSIWRALVWKELRVWRQLAVMALVMPPMLLGASAGFGKGSAVSLLIRTSAAFTFATLLVMWGAMKAAHEKRSEDFTAAHQPVPPAVQWLVSFAFPLIVASAMGGWYGMWARAADHWEAADLTAITGALIGACVFAIAHFLSELSAKWSAAFVVALGAAAGLSVLLTMSVAEARAIPFSALVIVLAGTVVGSLLFGVLLTRRPRRVRRWAALSVFPVMALLLVWNLGIPRGRHGILNPYADYIVPRIDSADWAAHVCEVHLAASERDTAIEFRNDRTGRTVIRRFETATVPLDFQDDGHALLIQQKPDEDAVRVLLWDAATNAVTAIAVIPAGSRALIHGRFSPLGFADPRGRYLLVALRSMVGEGRDLWLVDLDSEQSTVVRGNALFAFDWAQWSGGRAFLSGEGNPLVIDLKAGTARLFTLPAERKG